MGALAVVLGHAGAAVADNDTPINATRNNENLVWRAPSAASAATESRDDGSVRRGYGALKTQRERQTQTAALRFFQAVDDALAPNAPARGARPAQAQLGETPVPPQSDSADTPRASSATPAPGRVQFRGTVRYVMPAPDSAVSVPPAASAGESADTAADTEAETAEPSDNGQGPEQDGPRFIETPIGQIGVDVQTKPVPGLDPEEDPLEQRRKETAEEFAQHGKLRYGIMPYQPVASPAPALASSEFCHLPLYFEDARLERYGQTVGVLQPVLSGMKFFGTVPLIPYKTVVERPRECYTYNYQHEAGRRAPLYRNRYPRRLDAAVVETLAVVGLLAVLL